MAEPAPPPSTLRRSPSIALKNYEKWRKVQRHAVRPLAGLLAMKLPYGDSPDPTRPISKAYEHPNRDHSPRHAPDEAKLVDSHCIHAMKTEFPTLGLVLDLQNQDGAYTADGTGVLHWRVPHESKVVPSLETVARFNTTARRFFESAPPAIDGSRPLVAVHCHYGFNRTGFLICSYLVEEEGWDVEYAISQFAEVRTPGIKHAHFLEELRRRYKDRSVVAKDAAGGRRTAAMVAACFVAVVLGLALIRRSAAQRPPPLSSAE